MKGILFVILILALFHRFSCTTCTENQSYPCNEQQTVTDVTVGWCWKIWKFFRCKEEHKSTKTEQMTCHRTVCCNGYSRGNSWEDCKVVCFGSFTCPNGGSCVAPNTCICPSGYVSPDCEDENECSINNGGCSHTCVNTLGSYHCTCQEGFALESNQLSCEDRNECLFRNGGCSHTCENTHGSYHCTCPPGFSLDSNKLTCNVEATTPEVATPEVTAPDACGADNVGCSHTCVRVNGTVMCTCPAMMNLDDDNTTCIDDLSTHVVEVVRVYHGRGNDYCLCVVLILCVMLTTVRLTSKMYGWRWAAPCGYRKMPTKDQKPFVIAEECVVEFNDNNPPPYKEKRDETDISYKKTAIY